MGTIQLERKPFTMGRHLLRHVGVMAAVVAILTIVGVPWTNALTIGLFAGCMLMMFGMGHSGDSGADSKSEAHSDEMHRH